MTTVLIVEDSPTEANIISSCLQRAGFIPLVVTSSEAARLQLQYQTPDAIVLDVVLPGESGFELCRELRKVPATASVPIVICSTKDGDIDKFWAKKQGASAYVTKPIDQDELIRTMQSVLGAKA